MIVFWFSAAAMIIVSLLFIVPVLLREQRRPAPDRTRQDIHIARERLQALKAEHAQELISREQFEQAKQDIENALFSDIGVETDSEEAEEQKTPEAQGRWAAAVVAIAIPLVAGALYLTLGSPSLLESTESTATARHAADNIDQAEIDARIEQLVARLKQQPDDLDGWLILGKTYMALQRFDKAAAVFEKLHSLSEDQPDVLLHYASALAMANEGRFAGKPAELVKQAYAKTPNNPNVLWVAGIVDAEEGNYKSALRNWRQLLPMSEKNSDQHRQLLLWIADAENALDETPDAEAATPAVTSNDKEPAKSINIDVALDQTLADQVKPEDTLFVFAQALDGPPMPLAIVRKQVKDLPLRVKLDDSTSMLPAMKLSNFPQVRLIARISKSGQPAAQTGDVQGKLEPVTVGQAELLDLRINELIP